MLLTGFISKQGLNCITKGDSETAYHFVKRGYLEKSSVLVNDPDKNKNIIYYSLTRRGIRYLLKSDLSLPEWFCFCSFSKKFRQWGNLTNYSLLRILNFQDALAFFSMADYPTLLTELWNASDYAVTVLLGLSKIISGENRTMLIDALLDGLIQYKKEKESEYNPFISDYINILNGNIQNNPDLTSSFSYSIPRICYADLKEVDAIGRMIGRETENPNTLRDNCIGIFTGDYQDISVYISGKNGIRYSNRIARSGLLYNRLCALKISGDNSRHSEYRCTSAIILCHTIREFANAIADPINLRSEENPELCEMFNHAYVIPMTMDGIQMLHTITDIDPSCEMEDRAELNEQLSNVFGDIHITSAGLLETDNGILCFCGIDMDIKVFYKAARTAIERDCEAIIICEHLISVWSASAPCKNAKLTLRTIHIEYEDTPNGWNSLFVQ
jgi:hypothetical protein